MYLSLYSELSTQHSIDVFVIVLRTVNTTLRVHSAAGVDLVTMATHKLVLRRTVSLVRVL